MLAKPEFTRGGLDGSRPSGRNVTVNRVQKDLATQANRHFQRLSNQVGRCQPRRPGPAPQYDMARVSAGCRGALIGERRCARRPAIDACVPRARGLRRVSAASRRKRNEFLRHSRFKFVPGGGGKLGRRAATGAQRAQRCGGGVPPSHSHSRRTRGVLDRQHRRVLSGYPIERRYQRHRARRTEALQGRAPCAAILSISARGRAYISLLGVEEHAIPSP